MSYINVRTQGQKPRVNLPPFIEPEEQENKSDSRHSNKSGYQKDNTAATFTKEGLETLSLIFSSALEAAIAKSLPDIIQNVVERKLRGVIEQVVSEIQKRIDEVLVNIKPHGDSQIIAAKEQSGQRVSVEA